MADREVRIESFTGHSDLTIDRKGFTMVLDHFEFNEAIGWFHDCGMDTPEVMTEQEVIDLLNREYGGGLPAFLEDVRA
ncbi:hypothetical protein SEA_PARTRIDGE_69 [Rhodococcus phage Partridge]|uniref:Uncharacterized protein n=4 Tax=Rerduovirus TaxID=1982375 RepID=A0A1I9S7Y4_9CAUD|nr:hypothetical protein SEA_PARTRIDGE_69 [Rhodococcus phage Partridge]